MAKLSHTDSRRMYSWWWDSHISPKNSKWLQENLTDMDVKVKSMIKLIEEDADSFARRAEMYYKKRPELMKMVEDFYRAYRALAERYDHATGVIRHAHRTMSEAQLPMMFGDDSPASYVSGTDPRTPDMSTPNGEFADDSDSCSGRKTLKQFNDSLRPVERVRRGLNFDEAEEKEQIKHINGNNHVKDLKSDHESDSEEIIVLKEALAKLEAEKEAGLVQYQQSLDKLSQLESEISKTKEDFRVLKSKLQDYQQCVDRISNLEEDAQKLNERANTAETEAQSLKGELDKLAVEKDAALNQYMQSLEIISNLENKLRVTTEVAARLKERAEKAESEVEILRQTISKLTEEKEAAALQYQQCLEMISSLEHKLTCANEEAKRLNVEIDTGASKLKGAEEQCLLLERSNQSLHSELESLMLKLGTQNQELTEKQKELGRLWACVQEERLRFVEAETAFQTLQHLHAQTQEELRAMASELQNRAQLLKVAETQNHSLQDEVVKVKESHKHLDELNASSALSIKDMQNEISSLMESKGKLVEEVELRLDQRNALQQEIYCLKEELNYLNKKHLSILDQVDAVGLNPESLGSSVKELQDENSCLKETCQRESNDKAALLEKLVILEQLIEKNTLLETSLSDLNAELEAVRGKIEALEQSCQSLLKENSTLLDEKATLMTQLQETNKNLEKLSENNTVLESSLANVHHQLEAFKAKSKILEDSCQLLVNEKAVLISENDSLTSQLETAQTRLEDLGKVYAELEGRCINMEKEKESTLHKVEQLQMSLDVKSQEHANYIKMSETQFSGLEAKMCLLQEECQRNKRELDQVLDSAIDNEIEIFVLRTTAQALEEDNCSLIRKNQKLLEESHLSEKKISQLEQKNLEQQFEIRSFSDQASSLRAGTWQLLKVLDIAEDCACEDKAEQDQVYVIRLLNKLQTMKKSLCKAEEENLEWAVELSVLGEASTLLETNEELRSKLREGECNRDALVTQVEDLNLKLMNMQGTCEVLQREKSEISEEKRSLTDNVLHLEGKNNVLEEENHALCGKMLDLENLSVIFRSVMDEKFMVLRELGDDRNKLHEMNAALMGKLDLTEERLEESKFENLNLKERLQKTEGEFMGVATVRDQLSFEIENGKKVLHQMALELYEAEEKISQVEKEKLELNETVEDLKMECNEVQMAGGHQENQILKLSADNDHLSRENNFLHEASKKLEVDLQKLHCEHNMKKVQEENLHFELQKKINEINELETQAASVFDQNECLKAELAACGPEIESLKECVSSLENHTDIHIKFQNPENEEVQVFLNLNTLNIWQLANVTLSNSSELDNAYSSINKLNYVAYAIDDIHLGAQAMNDPRESILNEDNKSTTPNRLSGLRDLRVRLQAIVKAAIEIKELMVQENTDLHSKLDDTTRQLELLQSENGRYRRNRRPTSEITEADNALLTKDIVLDQISDGSSYGLSKRQPVDSDNQIVELWETADPDGTVGLTVSKSKKIIDSTDFRRLKSMRKQKSTFSTSDALIVDKLEISKRSNESFQDGNNRKVLERLDSDVQKLANLQITVQDLKRTLEVTEKGKRGKAVIECEALKGQLEEAEIAIMKLFELNGRLMKSVDDRSFSSSFDIEGDGSSARRRRVSEQARRMSEKIGRLQLEVQRLQFVLLKMDEGKNKMSETKRRILLRDYLYGGGRTGQRRKKTQFCAASSLRRLKIEVFDVYFVFAETYV
ncbi:hypothetical protein DH2020_024910 [Rehmannia glutinosa]|uniref:NAB domain-containing protein n=1 Tax=Rehmannia glutinosa TaxID=99300 RepID=A0ABR0W5G6_REHGL